MVEQLTLNQLVRGSSPRGATISAVFSQFLCLQTREFSRRRSSMVEHLFCKQAVAGSNPIAGSISPLRRDGPDPADAVFPSPMRVPWRHPMDAAKPISFPHCPMV
jgi:hypothetical protein